MSMNLTKRDVMAALGFEQDTQLAAYFDVTKQAVGRWAEDLPIPEVRQYQLRDRRPDLFVVSDRAA